MSRSVPERQEPGTLPMAIEVSMKRNAQLIETEDSVAELEHRLKRMRRDLAEQREKHRDIQILASLRLLGRASTWNELLRDNPEKAWKKETISAILSCEENEGELPEKLREDSWNEYVKKGKHVELCWDPEIFVLRTSRSEFQDEQNLVSVEEWFNHWSGLSRRRRGKYIFFRAMARIVRAFPQVFLRHYSAFKPCKIPLVAYYFLRNYPFPIDLFEKVISADLRQDSSLMLLAVQQNVDALSLIPASLKDSTGFAEDVVDQLGPRVSDGLKFFSERIKADRQVALAFCRANGRSYPHVAYSVRCTDHELVEIACQTFPTILLESVPGKIERKFTCNKEFMLSIFERFPESLPQAYYHILSPDLKNDVDIILVAIEARHISFDQLAAHWKLNLQLQRRLLRSKSFVSNSMIELKNVRLRQHSKSLQQPSQLALIECGVNKNPKVAILALKLGYVSVGDLPAAFAYNKDFWDQVICEVPLLWKDCPFAGDVEFCKNLTGVRLVLDGILQTFPSLAADVEFWRGLLRSETCFRYPNSLHESWSKHRPADSVYRDKEAMVLAVSHDISVYGDISEDLKKDRQIVEALMKTGPPFSVETLYRVLNTGEDHSDLCAKALESATLKDLIVIYEACLWENAVWSRRDVALAWLSKGGSWLDEFSEADFEAEKDFFLQAIDKNGMVYRNVPTLWKHDFDIVLAAWSTSNTVGDIFFAREDNHFVTRFGAQVREKLRAQDIFVKTILCGISAGNHSCLLQSLLLDQGVETCTAFKKRLAELLGISTGVELGKLRKASKHLELWGF